MFVDSRATQFQVKDEIQMCSSKKTRDWTDGAVQMQSCDARYVSSRHQDVTTEFFTIVFHYVDNQIAAINPLS